MSETTEFYKALKAVQREEAKSNRDSAEGSFHAAAKLARSKGLSLTQRSDSHYQLRGGRWLINLYPGNQRIYADRNKDRAPYLDVPCNWTLQDAVEAVAVTCNNEEGKETP